MKEDNLTTDLEMTAELKLYYDLYVPPEHANTSPLLISVHGYGAHKRYMMREARLVVPEDFVVAAIQAPHPHYRQTPDGYRIGFGWVSDEKPEQHIALHHKFILDIIEKLDSDGVIDTSRIYLYGFSQACALNFRFAFTHGDILRGVIGICGGIPGDLETNEIYETFDAETFYLYGDDDEFYTQDKLTAFDNKLNEILPNYRSKQYTAKHEITPGMRSDIRDWLAVK